MATNQYFKSFETGVQSEQDLYEDLVIESIQMYGFNAQYLPRNIVEEDDLLNEEVLSKFDRAVEVEMYITDVQGFEGEDFLSKFGLQVNDQCTLVVSVRRWEELVQDPYSVVVQPRPYEGDLIFLPFANALFEVRFCEDEQPFFQLNHLPVYEMRMEKFVYESQDFDTDIPEIDSIENDAATVTNVAITVLTGTFVNHEKLTLTTPAGTIILAELTGTVSTPSGTIFNLMNITYPSGEFISLTAGTGVSGDSSGAQGIIGAVVGLKDPYHGALNNDKFQDNNEFEVIKDDVLDFTNDNPFGGM